MYLDLPVQVVVTGVASFLCTQARISFGLFVTLSHSRSFMLLLSPHMQTHPRMQVPAEEKGEAPTRVCVLDKLAIPSDIVRLRRGAPRSSGERVMVL